MPTKQVFFILTLIFKDFIRIPTSSDSPIATFISEPKIKHTESSDLLPVLNQLHPHTLPDSRIRLFRLHADLLQHNPLCVRGATERRGLVGGAEETLLVM